MDQTASYLRIGHLLELYIWGDIQEVAVLGEVGEEVYSAEWGGSVFV